MRAVAHNPWLPAGQRTATATEPAAPNRVPATGATSPQPSVTGVDQADRLAEFAPTDRPKLWVVGAHGGAGESTVAELLGGVAASHRWPRQEPPAPVLLVARTHATGLRRAQLVMRAWAARQTPLVKLVGLVIINDAPGRLPRPLEHTAQTLGGGVPHVWRLPWVEELRVTAPSQIQPPRQVKKVLAEINAVLTTL